MQNWSHPLILFYFILISTHTHSPHVYISIQFNHQINHPAYKTNIRPGFCTQVLGSRMACLCNRGSSPPSPFPLQTTTDPIFTHHWSYRQDTPPGCQFLPPAHSSPWGSTSSSPCPPPSGTPEPPPFPASTRPHSAECIINLLIQAFVFWTFYMTPSLGSDLSSFQLPPRWNYSIPYGKIHFCIPTLAHFSICLSFS